MSNRTASHPDFQKRYDVLLDIGRVLAATLSPRELYRAIYEQTSRVLEATGFYISLYDEEADEATVVFTADRGEIDRPALTYRGSDSRAIREGEAVREEIADPDRAVMLLGPESDPEVTRSVLAAPLKREGRVMGVISAQSYEPHSYDDGDLELLEGIAGLAAVAISNAHAITEIERQRRESERMEEISRAVAASLDIREVLEQIVQATRELAEADGAGVWLIRDDGRAELAMTAGELSLPAGTAVDAPPELKARMAAGEPVVVHGSDATEGIPAELLDMLEANSAIGVPLMAEEKLIGALSVSHIQSREYRESEIRRLQRFAYSAAVAVANARLHDQLKKLSLTDPLTALPNRRQMDIFLEKEFAAAERGRDLTVILFDLDDFKIYNDTEGHQAGDEILRRFGEILTSQTRAMNLAARYGGDEFVCILSDTDEAGGTIHLNRVFDAVQGDPEMYRVGVSAGLASYSEGMTSPEDLIRAADEDMYRSKASRDGNKG